MRTLSISATAASPSVSDSTKRVPRAPKAQKEGLTVNSPAEAAAWADVIMILVPDTKQPKVYRDAIEPESQARKDSDVRATASTSASARSNRLPPSMSP